MVVILLLCSIHHFLSPSLEWVSLSLDDMGLLCMNDHGSPLMTHVQVKSISSHILTCRNFMAKYYQKTFWGGKVWGNWQNWGKIPHSEKQKAFSDIGTYSRGEQCGIDSSHLILLEVFCSMGSGKPCPLRSYDLIYNAEVALFSLLLNMGVCFLSLLEGSFPDGGQQAARSSIDWSQPRVPFYKAGVTTAWATTQWKWFYVSSPVLK